MHSYKELLYSFNNVLKKTSFDGFPAELYDPINYTMELGGKRMRPVSLLMSCDMFGGDLQDALDAAIGIEVFHNFTLIHDDIMDRAPIRRGKATVYKKWSENIAILSGDTMFALAYKHISKVNTSLLPSILETFTQTAIEICEGQQLDINFETSDSVGINDYLSMIRLKTAVLLAASLKIGAIIAGGNENDAENIYHFGENLGMAFQLKDDLLDAFGDEEKFGKMSGGDIKTNKKTFLYLKGLELANAQQKKKLDELFALDEEDYRIKISGVKKIYQDLNIPEITEAKIRKYYELALSHLNLIEIESSRKKIIEEFAAKLMNRES